MIVGPNVTLESGQKISQTSTPWVRHLHQLQRASMPGSACVKLKMGDSRGEQPLLWIRNCCLGVKSMALAKSLTAKGCYSFVYTDIMS